MNRLRGFRFNDAGVTLVELLAVVLILGILSSIVVVSINGAQHNAMVQACKADWQTVDNAANAYINDNATSTIASTDVYTKPAPSGSLANLGYMSQLSAQNGYKILLTGPAAGVYTVKVYNTAGTAQLPATGALNASADCTATASVTSAAAIPSCACR